MYKHLKILLKVKEKSIFFHQISYSLYGYIHDLHKLWFTMLNNEEISLLENISHVHWVSDFGENKKVECDPQKFKYIFYLC